MKKIIINESQKDMLLSGCCCKKQYPINPEKVLIVKKFLDKNFQRGYMDDTDDEGLPCVTNVVVKMTPSGQAGDSIYMEQLQDMLVHHFRNMFSDEDEKMKFLGQVMKDWYDNKIGLYGSLSVNHL